MIKKILLFTIAISASMLSMAGEKDKAKGFFASYHMSMMPNRDDLNADNRLNYVQTFKYGGGFEKLGFFNRSFGVGVQAGLWMAGQDYSGTVDTITKHTMKGNTNLTYGKVAFLAYHRSYNRYNPEARFKFFSYLGPYMSLLTTFTDRYEKFDLANQSLGGYTMGPLGRRDLTGSNNNYDLKKPIYKTFDLGFIVAPGCQFMISPKCGVSLNIRADISATGVENTGNLIKKFPNPPANPNDEIKDYWGNLYAKYYETTIQKDKYDVRAETKNITLGVVFGMRWYTTPQYLK